MTFHFKSTDICIEISKLNISFNSKHQLLLSYTLECSKFLLYLKIYLTN